MHFDWTGRENGMPSHFLRRGTNKKSWKQKCKRCLICLLCKMLSCATSPSWVSWQQFLVVAADKIPGPEGIEVGFNSAEYRELSWMQFQMHHSCLQPILFQSLWTASLLEVLSWSRKGKSKSRSSFGCGWLGNHNELPHNASSFGSGMLWLLLIYSSLV